MKQVGHRGIIHKGIALVGIVYSAVFIYLAVTIVYQYLATPFAGEGRNPLEPPLLALAFFYSPPAIVLSLFARRRVFVLQSWSLPLKVSLNIFHLIVLACVLVVWTLVAPILL